MNEYKVFIDHFEINSSNPESNIYNCRVCGARNRIMTKTIDRFVDDYLRFNNRKKLKRHCNQCNAKHVFYFSSWSINVS